MKLQVLTDALTQMQMIEMHWQTNVTKEGNPTTAQMLPFLTAMHQLKSEIEPLLSTPIEIEKEPS